MTLFTVAAIVCYLFAAFRGAHLSEFGHRETMAHRQTLAALLVAIVCHAVALHNTLLVAGGLNLGLFNAASLVAWCITVSLTGIMFWKPIGSLGIVIFPVTALLLMAALAFPSDRVLAEQAPIPVQMHIALSLIAYSLFAIATLQAVYLAIAEHKLKTHRPILHFLPPLPTMEEVLFQLTGIAFVLLSFSLLLGFLATENIGAQHLAHKIVFSVLAWLVFAALVIGRWRFHWRGRRAVKYVCIGFVLLALAFFGTKVVLEVILQRV